jgi:hypothetical protein
MDRHKIKPESKAFHLVSSQKLFGDLNLNVISASKIAADGSDETNHLRAGDAGPLFFRRPLAHTRVNNSFTNIKKAILRLNLLYFCSVYLLAVRYRTQSVNSSLMTTRRIKAKQTKWPGNKTKPPPV